MNTTRRLVLVLALVASAFIAQPQAQQPRQPSPTPPLERLLNAFTFRNIGVFRTAAWVTAIDVPESPAHDHLYTIYAATRSGGLWKTSNGGVTWDPISDSVDVAAVGAVAVAPSDPRIVWMGTGDQANARSSYSGIGVFKSVDAGKTWQFMGLSDSHHIARIVIHPKNPDIVYVAAMGHLFSRNEQRGVFRTTDGGKTWKKILYVHDGVGAIDLVINRQTPTRLYAAMYDKERRPWQIIESGPETGIYRSDNGGDTWQRLAGGLRPAGSVGSVLISTRRIRSCSMRSSRIRIPGRRPPRRPRLRESKSRRAEVVWPQPPSRIRPAALVARLRGPWRPGSSATSSIARSMAARAGRRRPTPTSRAARRRTRSTRSASIPTTIKSSSRTATTCTSRATPARPGKPASSADRLVTFAACGGMPTTPTG